jgi:hypothetical protein
MNPSKTPEPETAPLDRISHIQCVAEMQCNNQNAWTEFHQAAEKHGMLHERIAALLRLILMDESPNTFANLLRKAERLSQIACLSAKLADGRSFIQRDAYRAKANQFAKQSIQTIDIALKRSKRLVAEDQWESLVCSATIRRTVHDCLTDQGQRQKEVEKAKTLILTSIELAKRLTPRQTAESQAEYAYQLVKTDQWNAAVKAAIVALESGRTWLQTLENQARKEEALEWRAWLDDVASYFKLPHKYPPPRKHRGE